MLLQEESAEYLLSLSCSELNNYAFWLNLYLQGRLACCNQEIIQIGSLGIGSARAQARRDATYSVSLICSTPLRVPIIQIFIYFLFFI